MIKIHYHSDCGFFAGCESMLATFFNSENFQYSHELSFSYSYSGLYEQGLNQRIEKKIPRYPFIFPALTDYRKLPEFIPLVVRKTIMASLRFFLHFPLLAYEILVLYSCFKRISPEILHINNGSYPGARSAIAACMAARMAGIKIIVMVVNNMAVDYRHYSRWLDFPIDRIVVYSVSIFITGSQAANDRLQTVLNLPTNKLKTIHNGISLREKTCTPVLMRERLGLGEFKGLLFGVVALLVPRKGHQVLLDAVLELLNKEGRLRNEFKILIEGDGPLRETLFDIVVKNDLTRWVMFVGVTENVVDFMSAIDVLILPSIQDEDLPNVISEAMALGKPVIASRLAGTPEQVVEGVTGLLVEPRNASQLAEAIAYLVDNNELRRAMGNQALERFNTFFTSAIALSNYSNLYKKLTQDFR